jgi:hypothetical protein
VDESGRLERVRALCLGLPEVEERLSHGEPTWFVRGKKSFVMFCDHHHGLRLGFWCAAAEGVQELRIAEDPDVYYRPPYVGPRGWLGVNLDAETMPDDAWDEVAGIIRDAYLQVAPKSLAARLG